jgi:hypothetical protein
MDYIKSAVLILCCVFLFSCSGSYTKNETILRAESLLFTAPDSAYRLLSSIPHPKQLSKADYAAWCLNYTHACYKTDRDIKSDSIIRIAVNYYEHTQLSKQSGTAYYLLGCILISNRQMKDALVALKNADELLQNTTDINLKGLVKFNIGSTYFEDEVFDQSLFYYKKASNYFIASKNTKYQAYTYRVISDMYNQFDYPFDSVMHYSNLALKQAKTVGDTLNYYSIMAQQGELLYDKDYQRSKEYLLKGFQYFPLYRSNYSTLLAYTYSKLHKPDSARFYLRISSKDTSESKHKALQYYVGAYVAKDEGNLSEAFNLYKKAYSIRNAFFKETIRKQLYRLDKQYDLTQKEKENAELKIDNRNKVIVITLFAIVFLIGMIVFITLHNRNKSKRMLHEIENQKLRFEVEKKKADNEKKNEILLSKLQNKVENTLRFNKLNLGIAASDKLEAFVEEIKKQSMISDSEWQYYMEEINHVFDNKLSHLMNSYPQLTNNDVNVLTLICLKLDISDCCSLLNMNKNTMYRRRNTIKERMGINKDKELEEWVWEYLNPIPQ